MLGIMMKSQNENFLQLLVRRFLNFFHNVWRCITSRLPFTDHDYPFQSLSTHISLNIHDFYSAKR